VLENVDEVDFEKRAKFFRETWGPLARDLSLQPRPEDNDDVRAMRGLFLDLAVAEGGDPDLHAATVRLARGWLSVRVYAVHGVDRL
jgi:alanyl aminopeptidase